MVEWQAMSVSAFEALQLRLEQQRHWELAIAVRDGHQPSVDPDLSRLIELGSGQRVYSGVSEPFVKRLVAGAWRLEERSLY